MFLKGNKVRLYIAQDEGEYPGWCNSAGMTEHSQLHRMPLKNCKLCDDNNLILMIVPSSQTKPVGRVSLEDINYLNRTAELKIFIQEDAQGKGYATEACQLIIKHGFEQLNLRRIDCGTFELNLPMQKLALKLGFVEEGRRRERAWKNGKYQNIVEFGLLRREYLGTDNT